MIYEHAVCVIRFNPSEKPDFFQSEVLLKHTICGSMNFLIQTDPLFFTNSAATTAGSHYDLKQTDSGHTPADTKIPLSHDDLEAFY